MCATAFRINYADPYLKAYSQEDDETIVIVAGFEDGTLQQWVWFPEASGGGVGEKERAVGGGQQGSSGGILNNNMAGGSGLNNNNMNSSSIKVQG